MMNMLKKLVPALLLVSLLSGSAMAQGRVATVDLRKVFDGYWKKKQAEAAIKERQADMEKEDKNMINDYKKAKEEYQTLQSSATEPAISSEERDKRKNAAEAKLKQLRDLEETITQYERQARTTIGEQTQRMRNNLLTEIRAVVNSKAKAAGYSMVIDTVAESFNQTPIFLYTSNENDITDAVLEQLNATAPADTSKADEKPAEKADQKKDGKK